jgi:hypothetical protein
MHRRKPDRYYFSISFYNSTDVYRDGQGWRGFSTAGAALNYVTRQNERERKIHLAIKCGYTREVAETLFPDRN